MGNYNCLAHGQSKKNMTTSKDLFIRTDSRRLPRPSWSPASAAPLPDLNTRRRLRGNDFNRAYNKGDIISKQLFLNSGFVAQCNAEASIQGDESEPLTTPTPLETPNNVVNGTFTFDTPNTDAKSVHPAFNKVVLQHPPPLRFDYTENPHYLSNSSYTSTNDGDVTVLGRTTFISDLNNKTTFISDHVSDCTTTSTLITGSILTEDLDSLHCNRLHSGGRPTVIAWL